jgi:3-deoxy-manno-octulosonate cytidylyltransferase (CMP-KDO synthetase)
MIERGFTVAIPARLHSTRLPGKPLQLLAGEPIIAHVVRRAKASGARAVVVATDDASVAEAVHAVAPEVRVCLTRNDHASGTDRLAECAEQLGWDDQEVVVNLQGDEPFAPAAGIRAVAQALIAMDTPVATLASPLADAREIFDPNVVKVVRRGDGRALYFSRAPVPWHRDRFAQDRLNVPGDGWLRHIGIYAYRAGFLRRFAALPPGQLERIESLEQLRVLEAGLEIAVALSPAPFPPGIDTAEDLERAHAHLRRRASDAEST